jgi:DNA-binding transcriptional ArsR family regulator
MPKNSISARHLEYLGAVSNPLRRDILKALERGEATIDALQSRTNLDGETLEWHLDILQHALCVEKESRGGEVFYKITKQGRLVDHFE